jgi:hypothetical protein
VGEQCPQGTMRTGRANHGHCGVRASSPPNPLSLKAGEGEHAIAPTAGEDEYATR